MLSKLPNEIILEIGRSLEEVDLLALYSQSRRFREVISTILRRHVKVVTRDLHELVSLVIESRHFAISISELHLGYDDNSDFGSPSPSIDLEAMCKKLGHVLPERLNETLSMGNARAHVLALLASLYRLTSLTIIVYGDSCDLKYDVFSMLSSSSGSVLPKVKTYRYHEQDSPYQEWKSSAIFPTLSPDSRFQGQVRSELKEISVQQEKLDVELLKRMLQLPSHLTEFSYREPGWGERGPFAFSEFYSAMRPQAHSLQHLSIHLSSCLLRQINVSRPVISEEDMALGSLQEFDTLKTLVLPFDLLLGPNPDTPTLFVDLLPNSVEEITLKACMFETNYGTKIWASQQVYTTLLTGLEHLMGACPELKKLKLSCLAYRTFKEFQKESELYMIKLRKQGRTGDVKEISGTNEASDILIDDYKIGFDVEFDGSEVVIGSLVGYWDNTDGDDDDDDDDWNDDDNHPSVYSYQS